VQNPGVDSGTVPERHPLRLAALVAGGIVVVLALAAGILLLWLRTYAPLESLGRGSFAPGPGLGADVEPVTGSGGKPVFIPAYRSGRPFDTAFTLHNTGRFAVDVVGLAGEERRRPELQAVGLLATDSPTASADPGGLHPFTKLRLDRGDTAILVVRWRLDCSHSRSEVSADTVPLRYSYLSMFTRTERIRLPFAVTLRCSGGPPASP
jgi:hypothetical protein